MGIKLPFLKICGFSHRVFLQVVGNNKRYFNGALCLWIRGLLYLAASRFALLSLSSFPSSDWPLRYVRYHFFFRLRLLRVILIGFSPNLFSSKHRFLVSNAIRSPRYTYMYVWIQKSLFTPGRCLRLTWAVKTAMILTISSCSSSFSEEWIQNILFITICIDHQVCQSWLLIIFFFIDAGLLFFWEKWFPGWRVDSG